MCGNKIRAQKTYKIVQNFLTATNHDFLDAVLVLRRFDDANQYTEIVLVDTTLVSWSALKSLREREGAFIFRDTTALVGGGVTFESEKSMMTTIGRKMITEEICEKLPATRGIGLENVEPMPKFFLIHFPLTQLPGTKFGECVRDFSRARFECRNKSHPGLTKRIRTLMF